MANHRENQGLVVSLIIFATLSVALAVTVFALYSRDETAAAQVVAAQSRARELESRADTIQGELNNVKQLLGFADATPTEVIESKWRQDAATFAGVYPQDEGELDYVKLVTYLASEIRGLDDDIQQLSDSLSRRDQHIAQMQQSHRSEISILFEHFTRLKNDLASRTRHFADQWSVYVVSKDQLKDDYDVSRAESDAELQRLRQQLTSVNDQLVRAERLNRAHIGECYGPVLPEAPDGKITAIAAEVKRVYLNVGRADGLRLQSSFRVYSGDVSNVRGAKPKATVEVTRLLSDAHAAEARITESSISDPILSGDLIFSRIWSPGTESKQPRRAAKSSDTSGDFKPRRP